jgi:hypothetical protein
MKHVNRLSNPVMTGLDPVIFARTELNEASLRLTVRMIAQ